MSRYAFIGHCSEPLPVQVLCRLLRVSCAGYYQWRCRAHAHAHAVAGGGASRIHAPRPALRHPPPTGGIARRGRCRGTLRAALVAAPARAAGIEPAHNAPVPLWPTRQLSWPRTGYWASPRRLPRPSVGGRHYLLAPARRALVLPGHLARHLLPARGGMAPGRPGAPPNSCSRRRNRP